MNDTAPDQSDLHDRAACLVAAEKQQLTSLSPGPEMEIVGVSGVLGAGAMGSRYTDEWSLRLSLRRWRAVHGTQSGDELRIRLVTSEAEIDRIIEAIPGPQVVRMRVRLLAPPPSPASPLDALPAALLTALLDTPVEDADLLALAAQLAADDLLTTSPAAPVERLPDPPMTLERLIEAVKKKAAPAPEAAVLAFEQSIGAILPDDYRAFLVACNGGFLSGTLGFEAVDPSGEPLGVSIHHIGGMRAENHFSLSWARAIYRGRIPDDLLWIMDDPCGNAICLGLRGTYTGKVYFWDHENEPDDDWDGDVESAGNITCLADRFADFIAALRPTGL